MRTIKQLTILLFLLNSTFIFGQYTETFSTPNKGILAGTCSGSEASCTSDYEGVDWTINGNFVGMDANDYINTNGSGVLYFDGDIDEEMCYESPVLDISTVGFASVSVDVTWSGHDGADYIDIEYSADGGAWIQVPNQYGGGSHTIDFPNSGNTGNGTITQGGIIGATLSVRVCVDSNTFQEHATIDNVSVPEVGAMILPVKWGVVSVRSSKRGNLINWSTVTELNNDRFEIEKSDNDMLEFESIGSVEGAGFSASKNKYEYLDENISSNTSFYRIKQIDHDGKFEYSEIVVAKNRTKDNIRFSPNPFDSQILLSANQEELEEGSTLYMYNSQGEKILEKKITNSNINEPLSTEHLNTGMYFMQYSNGNIVRLIKL